MLDVLDFIAERGGDPEKIRESQRRRHAPESSVDEVISLYQEARKTRYEETQVGSRINAVQKEIGQLKKTKSDATKQLEQKAELEREKKQIGDLASEKEKQRDRKIKTIGNYVHDSVHVSDNEVCRDSWSRLSICLLRLSTLSRTTITSFENGLPRVPQSRKEIVYPITKSSRV